MTEAVRKRGEVHVAIETDRAGSEPHKRPPGRPPAGARKRRQFPIRLSAEELALITRGAELEGVFHPGTWLRELGIARAKNQIKRRTVK